MGFRDFQAFIPGWNIAYMIKEYRKFNRQIEEQKKGLESLEIQCKKDLELVKYYVTQRNEAKLNGESNLASEFDKKIADLALPYVDGRK